MEGHGRSCGRPLGSVGGLRTFGHEALDEEADELMARLPLVGPMHTQGRRATARKLRGTDLCWPSEVDVRSMAGDDVTEGWPSRGTAGERSGVGCGVWSRERSIRLPQPVTIMLLFKELIEAHSHR